MSQVKGAGEVPVGGVVQENPVEKKSIDKRWFVIIGLIVVLVVTLVVLSVISGRINDDNVDSGFVPYAGIVAGAWICDDGNQMWFYSDRSYIWMNADRNETESGSFVEEGGRLVKNRIFLQRGGQTQSSINEGIAYVVQRDGDMISMKREGNDSGFVCTRSGDD